MGRAAGGTGAGERRLRLEFDSEGRGAAGVWHRLRRESINPFRGLDACVTRELPEGGPAGGWQPQEKISLDDCIRAYTIGSAYAQLKRVKRAT